MDTQYFRRNLKILRNVHDISSKDLSQKIGLRQLKRISDLEDGKGSPSLDEVHLISRHFGVPLDKLLYKDLKVIIE